VCVYTGIYRSASIAWKGLKRTSNIAADTELLK